MPGINSVDTKLATFPLKYRRPALDISHVISRRAPSRMLARYVFAHPTLKRNQEVSRWQILLDLQVPFERTPEVLRPPEVDERKTGSRAQSLKQTAYRDSSPNQVSNCAHC